MRLSRLVPVASALLVGACASHAPAPASPDRVCTMMFAMVTIHVQNAAGQPVTNATLEVRNASTGDKLDPSQQPPAAGAYVVVDDGQLAKVATGGTPFDVTARAGQATATARIVVATDSARCHVRKVSGPDAMTLGT